MSEFEKKYKLDDVDDDIFMYIKNVIGISESALENINANYEEFYDNMTISESLTVILAKLLETKGETLVNGYPPEFCFGQNLNFPGNLIREFHFDKNNQGTLQTYKNNKWFPVSDDRKNLNYDNLLMRVMRHFEIENSRIMYHGTSWRSAISIMNKIRINQRGTASDFGLRNFYLDKIEDFSGKFDRICLTDTFQTACMWGLRNTYAAVVVFIIPDEFFDNLTHFSPKNGFCSEQNQTNYSILNENRLWQETVFKIRNPPDEGENLGELLDEYYNFLQHIDSNDLISGPIPRNVRAKTQDELDYITYGELVPYQYSFKDTTIGFLNGMLAVTLFFEAD